MFDHVGGLFGHHDDGSVGVAAGHVGHDGSVDDAQVADAVDAQPGVDDGRRIRRRSHFAGADGVVVGLRVAADEAGPVLVGVDGVVLAAGERLGVEARAELLEGLGSGQGQSDLDALDEHAQVLFDGEVARIDERMVVRIGRRQTDGALGLGPQQHGQHLPGVRVEQRLVVLVPDVVADARAAADGVGGVGDGRRADEVVLDVGPVDVGVGVFGFDPGQTFGGSGRRERSRRSEDVVEGVGHVEDVAQDQRIGSVDLEDQAGQGHVILQVVADGQIGDDGDVQRRQMVGRSDAAQHQQLRTGDGSGRQDHLAPGPDVVDAAVAFEGDAHGPFPGVVDDDARHGGSHGHVQVPPGTGRPQEGLGRRAAQSVARRRLGHHEARLLAAVAVVVLVAHLDAGVDEGRHQRRPERRLRHRQRPARAVVRRAGQVRIAVVLRFHEVGQHLVVGPAGVAGGGPRVVIAPVASHVQHVVQHRRSAQDLAARPQTPANTLSPKQT